MSKGRVRLIVDDVNKLSKDKTIISKEAIGPCCKGLLHFGKATRKQTVDLIHFRMMLPVVQITEVILPVKEKSFIRTSQPSCMAYKPESLLSTARTCRNSSETRSCEA